MNRARISLLSGVVATLHPLFAHAALDSIASVINKACYVVDILFTGAVILTIVFVLLAAVKYITKGSDPKAVSDAHQQLIWAAIGIAVAIVASVIPNFVGAFLEVGVGDPC